MKVIGKPQFPKGARLTVELSRAETQSRRAGEEGIPGTPCLCVKIPPADGNPNCRVFAYDVAVAGKLVKCVFAAGCNVSSGKEPKGGVTTVAFKKDELPSGETLTFSVTPRSCLGTAGAPIETSLQYAPKPFEETFCGEG